MDRINKKLKDIECLTNEFFEKMGFDVDVKCRAEQDTVFLDLRSDEPRILIGKKGDVLDSLQKILRTFLSQETGETFYLCLDINGYREKKEEYLKEVANELADEVSLTGREKELPAMSSYERRIIHLSLSNRADVLTESEGDEPRRRVIIKPRYSSLSDGEKSSSLSDGDGV